MFFEKKPKMHSGGKYKEGPPRKKFQKLGNKNENKKLGPTHLGIFPNITRTFRKHLKPSPCIFNACASMEGMKEKTSHFNKVFRKKKDSLK